MIRPETLVQGILRGGLYALSAAGLSLVIGIMRPVNLAHGDLIILAAFAILLITATLGLDPFLAARIAAPVMLALGWALQRFVLNRVLGKNIVPPLLVTFGLSVAIQNGLPEAFSTDTRRIPAGPLQSASVNLGMVTVGWMPLLTLATAVAVMLFAPRGLGGMLSGRTGLRLFPVQRRLLTLDPEPGQTPPRGGQP